MTACVGHVACPFCGREDGPYDPGDGLGCCVTASERGYWDEGHEHDGLGTWRWFHDEGEQCE
jgi:hypothetical protein